MNSSLAAPSWMSILSTSQASYFLCVSSYSASTGYPPSAAVNSVEAAAISSSQNPPREEELRPSGNDDSRTEKQSMWDVQRRTAELSRSRRAHDLPAPSLGSSTHHQRGEEAIAATQPHDYLRFVLLQLGDDSGCKCAATRRRVSVGSLVPSGMAATSYCQLIDEFVRRQEQPCSGGFLTVDVKKPEAHLADTMHVELRLSLRGQQATNLLVAAVEVYPEGSPDVGSPLPGVVSAISMSLSELNRLRVTAAAQSAELERLRHQLQSMVVKRLQDDEELTLRSVLEVVNAKKMKIRELTVAAHRAASSPPRCDTPPPSGNRSELPTPTPQRVSPPLAIAPAAPVRTLPPIEAGEQASPTAVVDDEDMGRHSTHHSIEQLEAYKAEGLTSSTKRKRTRKADNWIVDLFDMS